MAENQTKEKIRIHSIILYSLYTVANTSLTDHPSPVIESKRTNFDSPPYTSNYIFLSI